jgi:cytochrome c-type biogenesis protein CcmE
MKGKQTLILSIVTVVAALGFLIYTGLSDNMVYYYHVDEYMPKATSLGDERVKVNGKVSDGTIEKNQLDYQFVIHGSSGSNLLRVAYHGVVPDTFKNGSDVVVEGTYNRNSHMFQATTLMAKCPTKYEPQLKKEVLGTHAKSQKS